MSWLAKQLWPYLRPYVATWLCTRALVLPAAQRTILAAQLHVDPSVIDAVQAALEAQAVAELAKYAP